MQHNNVLVQNPIVQLLYKVELLKGAYLCITVIQSNQIHLNHFYCYLQNTSLNKLKKLLQTKKQAKYKST